jgi:hypothetical protein
VPRPASVHRELTGLDASLVAFHRGRIDANTYAHDLFRDDYKILDRYDGTQASDDPAPESEVLVTFDRSLIVLNGVLSGPFLDYLDNTLGYQTGRRRLYFGTYRGGHMFYLYDESRAELFRDVSGFYAN